jgi:hypothetical protein
LEKSRSRAWAACIWRLPLPLPTVRRSR